MKEREHVREKVSGRCGNGEGTHTDAEAADGETGGCDGGEKRRLIADEEVRAVQMKQNLRSRPPSQAQTRRQQRRGQWTGSLKPAWWRKQHVNS